MCKAREDMRNQTLKEGLKEVALRMLNAKKYTLADIVSISGLSLDEIKKLQNEKTHRKTSQQYPQKYQNR